MNHVWEIEIELHPDTDRPVANFAVRLTGRVAAPDKNAAGAQVVRAFTDFVKSAHDGDLVSFVDDVAPLIASTTARRLS